MKKTTIAILLSVALSSNAQGHTTSEIFKSESTWFKDFDVHTPDNFDSIVGEINKQATHSDLDKSLYYLRAYSYMGEPGELSDRSLSVMDKALLELTQRPGFYGLSDNARRLQEHYVVTLYSYYFINELPGELVWHRSYLAKLLSTYNNVDIARASKQTQYALWELIRSIGFLSYGALKDDDSKAALVGSEKLQTALQQFIADLRVNDWRLEHGVWALANLHILLEDEEGDEQDKIVKTLILDKAFLSPEQKKFLFSSRYLANSMRVKETCEKDFPDMCVIPKIEDALPIAHVCSDTLHIRANSMSDDDLSKTCSDLGKLETIFHNSTGNLATPVPNDFNESLRVVIFDNYSQYNEYGQLIFDTTTNNGGKYLEGTPSKPGNIATFLSFETFWKRPEFGVWNLNHEYVHYLDGRFIKYGGFKNFESHTVFWSEGFAQYVSEQTGNPSAFRMIRDVEQDDWPTLSDIVTTEYKDGGAMVYHWSYFAIKYLFENHQESVDKLIETSRTDYFEGYKAELESVAEENGTHFKQWLIKLVEDNPAPDEIKEDKKPKKLYRYLYRDYLQPDSLPITVEHFHHL